MNTRINKYLSVHLDCSRREADRMIEAGRVKVDGMAALPGQQILPGQQVMVDDRVIETNSPVRPVMYAVNKPVGVVCTSDRRWGDPLLEDLLPKDCRLFPLGRLDKQSEGLILVTNCGEIVNPVMRASSYHEKEYIVRIKEEITPGFLKHMREGVLLEELNVTTRPCRVSGIDKHTFSIVLTQGLNRQIRRMCTACGMHVVSLKRIRIMNIRLGDLASGSCRKLTAKEWETLTRTIKSKS